MPLRNLPIRRKVMLIVLLVSSVVSILTSGAFVAYEFMAFRRTIVEQLTTLGKIVAANSTAALAFENPNDAGEILSALKAEPHIVAAGLYRSDGTLFATYPAGLPGSALPGKPAADGYRFASSQLLAFQPVSEGTKRLGTLYLQSDTRAMTERLKLYAGIVALVMAGCLLVAYLLSRLLQKQITQPILALAGAADAVSQHRDYSVRAAKFGEDELGRLTDAFNQMLAQIQTLNQELEARVLERTAQLEAANRELESFSYSVSHDLRAPLRHISGFAGLLEKQTSLNPTGQRYLTTISDSARRMGQLIDDLLVFSQMGRSQLKLAPVDQDALVAAVIRDARYEHPVEWRISPLPAVRADAAMLRQVWANLIDNAVKYSGKSPQPCITIDAKRGEPAGEPVFRVSDNGVGFDMKYVDKLFGVFQRLHAVTEFEGTGIGLANVHRIVTRHGGRVWAEGRVGEGATFHFSLPGIESAAPFRIPPT